MWMVLSKYVPSNARIKTQATATYFWKKDTIQKQNSQHTRYVQLLSYNADYSCDKEKLREGV
jgi:hypothetical protein